MGSLALSGAAVIIASIFLYWRMAIRRRGGVRAQGTVIDNRWISGVDVGEGGYYPVIRFATQDGRTVEFVSKMAPPLKYKVGKQVPVVYQPTKPEHAVLDTAWGSWVIPTLTLAVGVALLLLGLIAFLSRALRG